MTKIARKVKKETLPSKPCINTLLLSGAGAKCIAYIGVFKKMQELASEKKIILDIREICGVSAGSIMGFLYILGYTIPEFISEILEKNLSQLRDIKYTNFFIYYGIDSGKPIMSWLETLLIKKGYPPTTTFKDLYEKTGIHFKVLATNLHKYKYTTFDYVNTPDFLILKAIRYSISIPFYFHVEKYLNDYHVDGALIDNYPITLYKHNLKNVFGIKSINYGEMDHHSVDYKIGSLDTFIYNIIYCFIVQKERLTSMHNDYKKHTIYIYTNEKKAVNFNLSNDEKLEMIDIGYTCCENFFKTHDPFCEN